MSLGITLVGHQKKIMSSIQTMRAQMLHLHGTGIQVWWDISPFQGRGQTWENSASLQSSWSAAGIHAIWQSLHAGDRRPTRSTYRLELLSATRKLLKKGKQNLLMAATKEVTINKVLPETPTNTLNSLTSFLSNGLFKVYIKDFKRKNIFVR